VTVFFSVVFEGQLVPGIGVASFGKKLFDPNDVDVEGTGAGQIPVTIDNLGSSGHYYAEYTPDDVVKYLLLLSHPTYFPEGLDASHLVYATDFSVKNDPNAVFEFSLWVGNQPVTGQVTGNFTFEVYNPSKQEVSATVPVTISELEDGRYRGRLDTSSEEGDWFIVTKHSSFAPTGLITVWRYRTESAVTVNAPTIVSGVNDETGTSATLELEADQETDELFVYYSKPGDVGQTLFSGSRVGDGPLQITGLGPDAALYSFVAVASQSGSASIDPSPPSNVYRLYVSDGTTKFGEVREALYDWVDGQVPITWIWQPANGPQPATPYGTIRMLLTDQIGHASVTQPDDTGERTLTQNEEFNFEAKIIGALTPGGDDQVASWLQQLKTSLQTRAVIDALAQAGIAYVETEPIVDLSDTGRVEFESMGMLEIRFRIGYSESDNVGYIETSDAPTGTVD
jgi:hypothetical protein